LAYLFSSLIVWLSVGPSTPFGGCSDTEPPLGGFSPAGVAEPSLDAFAAASIFVFLFFADLDSAAVATAVAPVEDAMLFDYWQIQKICDQARSNTGSTVAEGLFEE